MITEKSNVRIPSQILWRKEDGEVVLFDEESGEPYLLNEIGARIWELCQQYGEVKEILRQLYKEYEGKETQIKEDCLRLLNELLQKNLLEESEA